MQSLISVQMAFSYGSLRCLEEKKSNTAMSNFLRVYVKRPQAVYVWILAMLWLANKVDRRPKVKNNQIFFVSYSIPGKS